MAGPNYVLDKGFTAGGAIGQFRAVTLGASEVVSQAGSAGAACLGICQESISADDATSGRVADIRLLGISRCVLGTGGAAIGAKLRTDDAGKMTALAAATADQNVVGIALQAGVAVDHIDVFLTPGVQNTTT
jgi:hypothetical protein